MEFEINLAGLQPDSLADPSNPFPTVLIGRFVNVPAATEQRLIISRKLKHRG